MATDESDARTGTLYDSAPSTFEVTLRLRVRTDEDDLRDLFDDHPAGRIQWLTVYRSAHSTQLPFSPDEGVDVVEVDEVSGEY